MASRASPRDSRSGEQGATIQDDRRRGVRCARRAGRRGDLLTFDVAEPEDFWLHAAGGVAGSHVVVRNPEKVAALPRAVLERAAELAAWHSKARNARRVEVHVSRVADVSKRRGEPAGEVMLRRWERVRVVPRGLDYASA